MQLDAFKEPRGLMRLIQLLFAILAFATTAGYNSTMRISYTCSVNNVTDSKALTIRYPFYLSDSPVSIDCPPATLLSTVQPGLNYPFGSYTSSAQFYVFVGVMAFLYCITITVIYVFFDQIYQENDLVPQIDFIVTAVWTLIWFFASVAWAVGVSFLKLETSPERLWQQITACLPASGVAKCTTPETFGYGGLDVSLICGFANVFLWGANLWFLFKETAWFKRMHPEQAYAGDQPSADAGYQQQEQKQPGGANVETGAGLS